MITFHIDQLVWIDESGCKNKYSIQAAGYALIGMTPACTRFLARGKHVSCIAAIAYDGLIALEVTITTVDAQIFFDFVHDSLIPNMLPFDGSSSCSIAVMDNCWIHHADSVKELFR